MDVKDEVIILDAEGNQIASGIILNINDYREPSQKYAVDVYGYSKDVVFVGESQLLRK